MVGFVPNTVRRLLGYQMKTTQLSLTTVILNPSFLYYSGTLTLLGVRNPVRHLGVKIARVKDVVLGKVLALQSATNCANPYE